MKQRIVIYLDDKPVIDVEGSFGIRLDNQWEEIRTNPAMFAAMAGAPLEDWMDLPGETVEYVLMGRNIELSGTITKVNEVT